MTLLGCLTTIAQYNDTVKRWQQAVHFMATAGEKHGREVHFIGLNQLELNEMMNKDEFDEAYYL